MRVLAGPSRPVGALPSRQTHRRQQVSSGRMRRGTSSACAKRTHSSRWRLRSGSLNEDTSFTRSRDPCTSIVTELRRRKSTEVARRSRYRRRANPRKWERTGTGPWSADECAARRVSPLFSFAGNRGPEEVVRDASEKEGGPGHRPCEESGVPSSVSVRRVSSCRSRQAASWPRISSYAALEKGWR